MIYCALKKRFCGSFEQFIFSNRVMISLESIEILHW